MLVRVTYDPERGLDNPRICDLPTWGMIGYDPVALTMVVDIPPADFPAPATLDDELTVTDTHLGPVVHGMSGANHELWHKHLRGRYKELDPPPAPQLA